MNSLNPVDGDHVNGADGDAGHQDDDDNQGFVGFSNSIYILPVKIILVIDSYNQYKAFYRQIQPQMVSYPWKTRDGTKMREKFPDSNLILMLLKLESNTSDLW